MTVSQPLTDPVTILVGDVRDRLADLPDGSVDVVVTSPPYFGLRDYGTGEWEGGDPACDHAVGGQVADAKAPGAITAGVRPGVDASTCRRCGATRVDAQIGLEPTPEAFVSEIVAVFDQVKRVLADHGTVWLNLGDSYASTSGQRGEGQTGLNGSRPEIVPSRRPREPVAVAKPKDLLMVPARVAIALQAAGWYLRSEIIWAKPNPMPESVTDRPTRSHETIFLLAKRPRYYFDQEAVREKYLDGPGLNGGAYAPPGQKPSSNARGPDGRRKTEVVGGNGSIQHRDGERWPNGGRNLRTVWEIPTQPYADAHFATFPEALVEKCLAAGGPRHVCRTCGKPRERILEKTATGKTRNRATGGLGTEIRRETHGLEAVAGTFQEGVVYATVGWTDCGHDDYRPGRVLDPFLGSGTTGVVARRLGLSIVGTELKPEYAAMAERRIARYYVRPKRVQAQPDEQATLFG